MNRYKFIDEKGEHLHTLDDKPLLGTTTILKVISKELTWWASGMAVGEMGWKNPKRNDDGTYIKDKAELVKRKEHCILNARGKLSQIIGMNDKEYFGLLETAYKAHNTKKEARAEEGTDLHKLANEWIIWKMSGKSFIEVNEINHFDKLQPFIQWCEKNVKRFLFSEIHCYSESLWVGGGTDFGYEDWDNKYVLADIKSRDKDYFSDHVQCGGYDIQLKENGGFDKNGNKVFNHHEMMSDFNRHAIFTLGDNFKEPVFSIPSKNIEAFKCALGLYKLREGFEDINIVEIPTKKEFKEIIDKAEEMGEKFI